MIAIGAAYQKSVWLKIGNGSSAGLMLGTKFHWALMLFLWLGIFGNSVAEDVPAPIVLQAVDFSALSGSEVQMVLTMSQSARNPLSFTIDNPARIAFDFANTRNGSVERSQKVGVGMVDSMHVVEAKGRTRVVFNLSHMVAYESRVEGNKVLITLREHGAEAVEPAMAKPVSMPVSNEDKTMMTSSTPASPMQESVSRAPGIRNIDFRRTDSGAGRVIVTLSDASIPVDLRQEGEHIIVDFAGSNLPTALEQRLDVVDFSTPVKSIETRQQGKNTRMTISPLRAYEHLAYQTGNIFTIELNPITKAEQEQRKKNKAIYTGDRLSLNFQDIEVRSVLQLIADFTGINVVVSDTVSGNLTLRLKNVPWDQALDIVLTTKGLAKRQNGNVMLVAPSEEIAAREKLELESQKQLEDLKPLYAEFLQINYAKAADLSELIKNPDNSLLSVDRGSIAIDERTNTLMVQDTATKLAEIRKLVTRLDVPVRQVLIESRIVIANNDFSKDLGVRFGATGVRKNGDEGVIVGSGTLEGTSGVVNDAVDNIQNTGQPFPVGIPSQSDRLMVDLAVTNPFGSVALAILDADYLLDLELTAMQAENRGEIISSPRVITSNQKEAVIKQGVEIPYLQASSSGATSVSFRDAVLSLRVTPQITPDDHVILDLSVNKDSVGEVFSGVPSINTREVTTQVLVNNGETVVLGGVYEQTRSDAADKVPFLGDLPGVGALFRQTRKVNDKSELLIFVTPKIVKDIGIR